MPCKGAKRMCPKSKDKISHTSMFLQYQMLAAQCLYYYRELILPCSVQEMQLIHQQKQALTYWAALQWPPLSKEKMCHINLETRHHSMAITSSSKDRSLLCTAPETATIQVWIWPYEECNTSTTYMHLSPTFSLDRDCFNLYQTWARLAQVQKQKNWEYKGRGGIKKAVSKY